MSTAERLQAILNKDGKGFPKKGQLPSAAFAEVLEELRQERTEAAKSAAKDLLIKALTLDEQGKKIDNEYKKTKQKFDKELGGILKQIDRLLSGKDPSEQEEEKTEPEAETTETTES